MQCGALEDQKMALGFLELELQVVMSCPPWTLGTELRSYRKAAHLSSPNIWYFLYLYVLWWALRWIPYLDYCGWCCSEIKCRKLRTEKIPLLPERQLLLTVGRFPLVIFSWLYNILVMLLGPGYFSFSVQYTYKSVWSPKVRLHLPFTSLSSILPPCSGW